MGRITALIAGVAAALAAAGAAIWAKRRQESEDAALEQEIIESIVTPTEVMTEEAQAESEQAVDRQIEDELADAGQTAGNDLTTVKGIGAVNAERLAGAGVTTFSDLAAWTDEDIDRIGAEIKVSPERIRREDWVGQARTATEG